MNKKHSAPKRTKATKKNIARQPRAESDANETNANRAGWTISYAARSAFSSALTM